MIMLQQLERERIDSVSVVIPTQTVNVSHLDTEMHITASPYYIDIPLQLQM